MADGSRAIAEKVNVFLKPFGSFSLKPKDSMPVKVKRNCANQKLTLGGGNSKIFYFHLYLGRRSNLTSAYFLDGLVQPPT